LEEGKGILSRMAIINLLALTETVISPSVFFPTPAIRPCDQINASQTDGRSAASLLPVIGDGNRPMNFLVFYIIQQRPSVKNYI
jgi:hypothetical protein